MSQMTDRMSQGGSGQVMVDEGVGRPRKGERYRCKQCGMEVQVTADCGCQDSSHVHFHCCGQELQKV